VDPVYYDHPYFPVPASEDDGLARAYRLLSEVISRTDRAALGRLSCAKEYLAIIRHHDGVLTRTTICFADEIRGTDGVSNASQKAHAPTRKQLAAAVAVIEELSCEWDPEKFKDRYRARLKRVVDRKRKGETSRRRAPRPGPSPRPISHARARADARADARAAPARRQRSLVRAARARARVLASRSVAAQVSGAGGARAG
jgi:DNA end-binding protein Ku